MRMVQSKIFYLIVGTSVVLSLQGCDQISKIFNSISGKKDTVAKSATPTPISVKPISTPAASATSVAASKTPAPADLPPNVLAKVGNWSLSIQEFKEQEKAAQELAKQNQLTYDLPSERLLGMIVEQQLLFQEALRQGLEKDSKIAKQMEEARKLILSQSLQTKMVEQIKVSDEDIATFYEQNKQFYFQPAEYKLTQIVVDTEQEANELLTQLAQGGNFTEIATAKSRIKPDGNFIAEEKLFLKLKDVVNALDQGKFSAVFQGPDGFYIVKLEEKRGGKERTLEEVKEGIKQDVSYLKYLQGLQEVQKSIPVQTNLKLLEAK